MDNIISNLNIAIPAIFMGAVIPCAVLIGLLIRGRKKQISFVPVLYGFGTFFAALIAVAVLALVLSQIFFPSIALSNTSDAKVYIYAGGAIILLLLYLCTEALKLISFQTVLKSEKKDCAGVTFGCGFVLAQNLLIFGLLYTGDMDLSQAIAFGLLMLISGVIYILMSVIGYQFAMEKQRYAGSAIVFLYFLMFAVMLLFANIYITYGYIVLLLAFVLVISYITLPLPFKKKKENIE
ncbi:MAG: hypothetical protein IJ043_06405 [Clostridia bacterium]|nr:hypothetical protein [Clostridia bacterium]